MNKITCHSISVQGNHTIWCSQSQGLRNTLSIKVQQTIRLRRGRVISKPLERPFQCAGEASDASNIPPTKKWNAKCTRWKHWIVENPDSAAMTHHDTSKVSFFDSNLETENVPKVLRLSRLHTTRTRETHDTMARIQASMTKRRDLQWGKIWCCSAFEQIANYIPLFPAAFPLGLISESYLSFQSNIHPATMICGNPGLEKDSWWFSLELYMWCRNAQSNSFTKNIEISAWQHLLRFSWRKARLYQVWHCCGHFCQGFSSIFIHKVWLCWLSRSLVGQMWNCVNARQCPENSRCINTSKRFWSFNKNVRSSSK